jgi:hypothetical protein
MSATLADVLLRLAAAVSGDGGHGVLRVLDEILADAAPFDAGELAFLRGETVERYPVGPEPGPLVGRDLMEHVMTHAASFRIDDLHEVDAFPEAAQHLRARGMRSLLVLPFRCGGPPGSEGGVLAVGRRYGWAFVGTSLPIVGPLAALAGLALDRSLALTALAAQNRLRPAAPAAPSEDLRARCRELEERLQEATRSTGALFAGAERHRTAAEEAARSSAERERERDEARAEAELARLVAAEAGQVLRDVRAHADALEETVRAREAKIAELEAWSRGLQGRVDELEGLLRDGEPMRHALEERDAARAEIARLEGELNQARSGRSKRRR